MSTALKLSHQIEKEKQVLIKKYETKGSLLNKEVLERSQHLDQLIIFYMKIKNNGRDTF